MELIKLCFVSYILNETILFFMNFEQIKLLIMMYVKIDFFFYIFSINGEILIKFCIYFDVYKI